MNREELEKEADDWVKANTKIESCPPWGDVKITPSGNQGYIAGAEPREKQIEQLKQENEELTKKLEGAERARDYWKDSSFDWRHKCTSRKPFRAAVKAQKQLSKAKELIEDMYDQIPSSHSEYYKDVMERARQFFKELEE